MQGYEVFESPNGEIAIGLLQQQPKLIMLDLGHPDIAGHDLWHQIRTRNESDVPQQCSALCSVEKIPVFPTRP
jgi:DNA-binding response OmpR family regulator